MLWFSPAVTIKAAPGRMRDVNSVEGALEAMRGWPVRPKLRAAYVICAEVFDGTKTVDDARKAFVSAAKEAGAYRDG